MIVREILDDPTIAQRFDYFNDFKDTRNWLAWQREDVLALPEVARKIKTIIDSLEAGHDKWITERNAKFNERNERRKKDEKLQQMRETNS